LIDAVTLTSVAPVADQGFDQVSVGAGQSQPDPTGSPWTFSGTAGIAANDSGIIVGNPPAPQGVQVAYLEQTGSFSQDVPGWIPGTYQLSITAAQRASNPSRQDFKVLIDGVSIPFTTGDTITPAGTSYWNYTSAPFTISNPGSHTITLQGLDTAGGDNTAFIDQVAVEGGTSVPIAAGNFQQVSVAPAGPITTRPAPHGPSLRGPHPAGPGSMTTRAASSPAIHRPLKAFRSPSPRGPVHSANRSSAGAPVRGLPGSDRRLP
jgi:hypothetical protein